VVCRPVTEQQKELQPTAAGTANNIEANSKCIFQFSDPRETILFSSIILNTETILSALRLLPEEDVKKCIAGDADVVNKFYLNLLENQC
jgi:hypothetical protein